MFKCSPVFYENYNAKEKVLINQGGTSSSKTYSIMQLLFYKAVTEHRSVITVAGESLPNLRKGSIPGC
jgi:phage terminase large subunit